jgi:phage terminase large subunit-like protein
MVNLAQTFKQRILSRYEGTRLGRQELYAEILDDAPGALWTRTLLDQTRVHHVPRLTRIVLGLDPGHEAGIVAVGLGEDGHGYVLEDLSISGSPDTWAGQAVAGYHKLRANLVVAESNHGADMVITILHTKDATVATKKVWASQGKYARAEPVSALYEQQRIHHVGMFATLEDQMCTWSPGEGLPSPNELDACVWALTELMLGVQVPTDLDMTRAFDASLWIPPLSERASGPERWSRTPAIPRLRRWAAGEDDD